MFPHDLRLEGGMDIPRHVNLQGPARGVHSMHPMEDERTMRVVVTEQDIGGLPSRRWRISARR